MLRSYDCVRDPHERQSLISIAEFWPGQGVGTYIHSFDHDRVFVILAPAVDDFVTMLELTLPRQDVTTRRPSWSVFHTQLHLLEESGYHVAQVHGQ